MKWIVCGVELIGVTMSGLISRQDAIEAMKKIMYTHLFECGEYIGENTREISIMNAEKALDVIENLPSAEPERKKGKWIDEKINSYTSRTYCSECGNSAPFICVSGDHYGRNMHGKTNKTKFCPNCGAKME